MCACVHQLLFLESLRTVEEVGSLAERRGFILKDLFTYDSKNIPGVRNVPSSTASHCEDAELDGETGKVRDSYQSGIKVRVPQCSLKRYVRYESTITTQIFPYLSYFTFLYFTLSYLT